MFRAGRRRFLLAAAGLGSTLGLGAWRQFGSRWIHEETGRSSSRRTSQALGTKVSIVVLHDNAQQANAALDDAFAAIEQVEAVMSIYRPDSELRVTRSRD